KEVVYPLADGRIYTGLQAYNLGLVDTLGTLKDAIAIAAEMAGLEGDPETVKEIKKKPGLIDLLGEANATMREIRSLLNGKFRIGPELLYLYH
ncbi:MAG: S49 family peptidase, partial [candidate division Zixibacteria bacterium]|nr:S49 family peptidase [candidate division Zixibacteria bacterium]